MSTSSSTSTTNTTTTTDKSSSSSSSSPTAPPPFVPLSSYVGRNQLEERHNTWRWFERVLYEALELQKFNATLMAETTHNTHTTTSPSTSTSSSFAKSRRNRLQSSTNTTSSTTTSTTPIVSFLDDQVEDILHHIFITLWVKLHYSKI